jgi:Polyketide cyclase / dehydrase and lipid transport
MAKAAVSHKFDLTADALWDLIGDFGNTSKWSGSPLEACVQQGEGIGALRTLTVQDGRQIVDRLDAVGERSYCYSIVTSPLPVASYSATMAVTPIDDASCELIWSGEFEPKGISDEQAVAFFINVYHSGIAMMTKTIAKMG